MPGTVPYSAAVVPRLRRFSLALAWSLVAVLIALGGAGIVARADNFAGDIARPELTWRYDQAMAPGLNEAAGEAMGVQEATDKLADSARSALVHLLAGRTDEVSADLQRGEIWLADITTRDDRIEAIVAGLPFLDSPQLVSSRTREKIAGLRAIVEATRPLPGRWQQLEQATVPAVEVTAVMQAHDTTVFEATQEGVREDYEQALSTLATALTQLDQVGALRDRLAPAVDVSTLSQWIDRSRAHDEALIGLYQAVMGGDADEIAAAVEKQQQAEQQLPPDTRALVVILGDIALGGVQQAAIAIETVRGTVDASVAALD